MRKPRSSRAVQKHIHNAPSPAFPTFPSGMQLTFSYGRTGVSRQASTQLDQRCLQASILVDHASPNQPARSGLRQRAWGSGRKKNERVSGGQGFWAERPLPPRDLDTSAGPYLPLIASFTTKKRLDRLK